MDSDTKLEFILVHVPQIHGGDIEMKLTPPQNSLFGY
jgi:hypothetical protein